jgi:hypothetical protein
MIDKETGKDPEDRILELARALPGAIEPDRDLWDGIEARLEAEGKPTAHATRNRFPLTAIAASLVAVLALASFWAGNRIEPDNQDPSTLNNGSNVFVNAATSAGFGQTRQELALRVADQVTRLPEPTRELVVKNLNAINAALDEIDSALKQDSTADPQQRLLLSMYTEQLTLLGEMEVMLQRTNEGIRL